MTIKFFANFSAEVILIKMKRQLDQLASVVISHHLGLSAEARYWTTEHGLQGWLWKVSAKYLLNNAEPSQCYNATSCWFHPGWCKNCKLLNFQDLKCLAPKDLGMTTQHILKFWRSQTWLKIFVNDVKNNWVLWNSPQLCRFCQVGVPGPRG